MPSTHDRTELSVVLDIEGLVVEYTTDRGVLRSVNRVDMHVSAGETVAVIGESGCGKSSFASAVLGVLPRGARSTGSVRLLGQELLGRPDAELRRVRGSRIAMIPQEPLSALNPLFTAGWQVAEVLRVHGGRSRRAAKVEAVELCRRVGIPNPEDRVKQYPHQLSGGMRQRIAIAIAIALEPAVLIADEPTSALDATVQAQILDLLRRLQQEAGTAVIFITHDFGIVASVADHVATMYAGKVVEFGAVAEVCAHPRHPYTAALLAIRGGAVDGRLPSIQGAPPDLMRLPPGCSFHPRCPSADATRCRAEPPELEPQRVGDAVASCHHPLAR